MKIILEKEGLLYMKNIILLADTGADLSQEQIEKFQIKLVNMHINMGGSSFSDRNLSGEDIINYYKENKVLAQTSGANPYDFQQVFEEIRRESSDPILYVSISKDLSVSHKSAEIAAADFDDIYILDSGLVSIGTGILIKKLAEYIEDKDQVSVEEIISYGEEIKNRIRLLAIPQSLEYLKAGGRLSNSQYLGAILFKIFPLLTIDSGKLVASKKFRGSFRKSLISTIEEFFAGEDIDLTSIELLQSHGLTKREENFIEDALKVFNVDDFKWTQAGPLIASHAGPGVFGIAGLIMEEK